MNGYQQPLQPAKQYQGGHAQVSSSGEHGLSTNYYLQKVGQHSRATSDGAISHQMHEAQAKDLSKTMDRQYQQNDRKIQQSKDGSVTSAQQQANERKYSLQLSLQDPAAVRGSSQQPNLNLTQIDYTSQQYNYAGHGFGSNTTKNEQLRNQKGIDFAGAASSGQHGQTQDAYAQAMSKHGSAKGEAAGRHQSAPRSGRGEEGGAGSNAQGGRDRNGQKQEYGRQHAPHTASGSLRSQQPGQGQAVTNSGDLNAVTHASAAMMQGHHTRKQSHHVGQYQNMRIDNSSRHPTHGQLNQSQQVQRGDWVDKDGKVYQGLDDSRNGDIELKKKGHKGSQRMANTMSSQGATDSINVDAHGYQKGSDGKAQMDDQSHQPKQQARVNGNTFKNYNGKKIISIQNSYQKAQIQKNQHNSSSSGIQQQKSGSAGTHNRKRSDKDGMKPGPVSTTSYQKVHTRAQQDKAGEQQTQAAADPQEEDAHGNQQNDNAAGPSPQSLVCQVPQNQANGQQMQRMLQLQQQQLRGQAAFPHGQGYAQEQEWLIGPQAKNDVGRKTLVLDLDETLVHSQFKPVEGADIVLPVEIEGQIWEIYILVRPGVSEFLHRMAKHYELVVFTASLSKYAEPLVAQLDPDGLCTYKLFREHCTQFNNAFVKDLTRLGRPMTDVIIVDNSPIAYLWQPENAIPCTSWYDDMSDVELDRIATILEKLAYEEDVRRIIRRIIKNNQIDDRAEQIYLTSHKRDRSQRPADGRRSQVDPAENVIAINGMRPSTTGKTGEQQQPGAATQHPSQREKAEQRASAPHHQRYESADNKQKYQAIVNEKMRRKNEVADQFSMNDAANYEQVLRFMHESGQVARQTKAPGTSDGSSRKNGRRMQDPVVQVNKDKSAHHGKGEQRTAASRGSGSTAGHGYGHAAQTEQQRSQQYQDRDGNFAQKRSIEAPNQNSTRAAQGRHGGTGPAPLMGDKKMQDMYQQQHLQLNYHPQTTKGTPSQAQQFNFENQGQKMRIRDRQGSQHITVSQTGHQTQVQSTPAAKRAASVKNQNNAQILREQQQILAAQQAQLNKAQQAHSRSRVYSAGSSNQAAQISNPGAKGKAGQLGQAGNTGHPRVPHTATHASTVAGQMRPTMGAAGQPPISSSATHGATTYHRKKGQVGDHQVHHQTGMQSSSAAHKLQKSHSQNRQASGQRANAEQNQNSAAPRAQSSGNRPGVSGPTGMRGTKDQNYQHAQRAQIHNYFSDNVPPQPQGSHAFVSKNGQIQFDKTAEYAAQRGARSSQGAQTGSTGQKGVKQNLKDYSQSGKQSHDGQARGNGLGVKIGLQTHYGLQHGVGGPTVSSTKAGKKPGLADGSSGSYPSTNHGGHQLSSQYSHRGEELGFLGKLTQQSIQNQQHAERRDGDPGQQPPSNRALQAMYLAGGVGGHAPHGVQISLNSPKYGQPLNFMGHGQGNNPSSPVAGAAGDSYLFQSDSSNSQFNRTGPIILNNRTSIADAHFYHQLGVAAPISTKNSNISHATKAVHPGSHAVKDAMMKQGHGRSTRGTSSSHNPYHTQGISGHNQLVSNSVNLEPHQQQRTLQGHDGPGGMKLKLSKKQKSTTIEPQNPMMQNPPKTAPSGHSAIQLSRQIDYQGKQHGAPPKYVQQARGGQASGHNSHQSSSHQQNSGSKGAPQQDHHFHGPKSGSTRQGSIGNKKGVSNSIQFQVNSFQPQQPTGGAYAGSSTNI